MAIEILDGFKFLKGSDGSRKLIIESSKLEDCIKYVLEGNIKTITINSFQGYNLPNIDFLARLSDTLEGLHIPESKFNIQIINSLHKLKWLGYANNKKDIIELSNFPDLETLACDYSSELKGLENCKKLVSLSLTKYSSKNGNLSDLPDFLTLQELHLFKPNIVTLNGIERFINLRKFQIFGASKLETISEVQFLSTTLEEIEIGQCKKITDFQVLGIVKTLRKIILSESGNITNLTFIKQLPLLKFFSFWDTNVLDGDISYCENIAYVGFDNKKHYNRKSESFKK